MTAVVAAGVGALIATTPAALTALTVVGGSYLVWLGTKTTRHPATLGGRVDEPTGTARGTLLRGMAVSGLNPKGLLIFVALLPQFAHPHAPWPVQAQLVVLGLAFTLTCGVSTSPSAPPPENFSAHGRLPPTWSPGSPGQP
jgi:threonine/homoserine/homoserine lactone efflux protein